MRRWTPRQAGYDPTSTITSSTRPDCPEAPGSPVDFVLTRHGAIARVRLASDFTEVLIRRPRNDGPTFQGTVRRMPDGWTGFDPDGQPVTDVHSNYLDAEAPLLLLKTRHRSAATFPWPNRTGGPR